MLLLLLGALYTALGKQWLYAERNIQSIHVFQAMMIEGLFAHGIQWLYITYVYSISN
jgi:hypothetical protein